MKPGDIVEYFKEEFIIEDKDKMNRLLMKPLNGGRRQMAFENDVYYLRPGEDEELYWFRSSRRPSASKVVNGLYGYYQEPEYMTCELYDLRFVTKSTIDDLIKQGGN